MPCSCQNQSEIAVDTASSPYGALSTQPIGVCRTAPCSTRRNIAEIQASFTPPAGTDCSPIYPVPTEAELLAQRSYRPCVDENGCAALYPEGCRDGFWPDFAHPRWLCCSSLYNVG